MMLQSYSVTINLDRKRRKSLLLSVINKNVKDFLLQSGTEIYLFGEDLGEEIRTARSVKRSGQELRWLKQKGSLQSEVHGCLRQVLLK